jgi:hypothetical protein
MRILKSSALLLFLIINSCLNSTEAQSLAVGDNDLNAGIGFVPTWIKPGYYSVLPPISISLDHGLRDDWGKGVFTVGGLIGVARYAQEKQWHDTAEYTYGYKYISTIFAARATYHYPLFAGLDTYIGLMGGFRVNTNDHYGTWPSGINDMDTDANFIPVGRIFVGAKYSFTNRFSGFGELGYGISYVTLGVSLKL